MEGLIHSSDLERIQETNSEFPETYFNVITGSDFG